MNFKRFIIRVMDNVTAEIGLIAMAQKLNKFRLLKLFEFKLFTL